MKIIIVGGTGAIGKAIVKELSPHHEIITVGYKNGDIQADISNSASIEAMYQKIGKFDALISATGSVHYAALPEMTTDNYHVGLENKLMGQVNLILLGLKHISDAGSFTLTSGILGDDPIRYGSSAAMVNGALNSFVKAAAIEMPRHIRINAVSPTILTESKDKYDKYFQGFEPTPGSRVALAYRKSVDGAQTGQVYRIW